MKNMLEGKGRWKEMDVITSRFYSVPVKAWSCIHRNLSIYKSFTSLKMNKNVKNKFPTELNLFECHHLDINECINWGKKYFVFS